MKLRDKTKEQLVEEAFAIFNGGDGLDHWSYSSTSTPFAKNIIQYTFPEKIRRSWLWRWLLSKQSKEYNEAPAGTLSLLFNLEAI